MNTVFDRAFHELIGIEGGYVNDPLDKGGETKYGISKRAFPHVDIKNLTLSHAKAIYKVNYWNRLSLDNIDDPSIKTELFDTAVNMGTGIASRMLQRALNLMNRNGRNFKDLVVDGAIGKKTVAAYQVADKKVLLKVLNGLQFMRYTQIVERDPTQERFFNGWMLRV